MYQIFKPSNQISPRAQNIRRPRPIKHMHQRSHAQKESTQISQHTKIIKIAIPICHHKHSSMSLKPPKWKQAKIWSGKVERERMARLYCNDIWVKARDELSELRPVLLNPEKKAISIPRYELKWLFLAALPWNFSIFWRRWKSGLFGRPIFLYWSKETFHRLPGSELQQCSFPTSTKSPSFPHIFGRDFWC